jgi:hypothetical protein
MWLVQGFCSLSPRAQTRFAPTHHQCTAHTQALDLIDKLLEIDPTKRISAKEAIKNQYFWTDPLPCDPSELPVRLPIHPAAAAGATTTSGCANTRGKGTGRPSLNGGVSDLPPAILNDTIHNERIAVLLPSCCLAHAHKAWLSLCLAVVRDVARVPDEEAQARGAQGRAGASNPAWAWVTLRARWVTLRARWLTLRARWVTLRARWVTLRAR